MVYAIYLLQYINIRDLFDFFEVKLAEMAVGDGGKAHRTGVPVEMR